MAKNFTSTIAGASILITLIGLLGKGFGFFREVVYAGYFGLQTNFDVYLIGAVIPVIINTSINFLAQNYFIPSYHNKLSENKENAEKFFYNSFWLFIFSSVILGVILFIISPYLIAFYLSRSDPNLYRIALKVFQIFLLTIPFNAGFSILASYSQAEFNFKSPAISSLFQNLIIIALVLIFSNRIGIFTIPWGYFVGTVVQFLYMFLIIKKTKGQIFRTPGLNLKELGFANKFLIITILIEVVNQLYILIDRYFYGSVDTGGIAGLNYASVLFNLPISIFSLALSTAIFPKISQTFYNKNFEDLRLKIFNGIKINIFIFVPITTIFILFGDSILKLLYERGKFSYHDTEMTFQILRIYVFSLIFYSSYAIINKVIYGSGLIKQLLNISIAIFLVKIILNVLLVGEYKQNGLALSTMISYILLAVLTYFLLFKKFKLKRSLSYIYTTIYYILTGSVSFILLMILKPLIPGLLNSIAAPILFILFYTSILITLKPDEYKIFRDSFIKIFID